MPAASTLRLPALSGEHLLLGPLKVRGVKQDRPNGRCGPACIAQRDEVGVEVPPSTWQRKVVVIRDGYPCRHTPTVVADKLAGEVLVEHLLDELAGDVRRGKPYRLFLGRVQPSVPESSICGDIYENMQTEMWSKTSL
jgi:hypothetical protein